MELGGDIEWWRIGVVIVFMVWLSWLTWTLWDIRKNLTEKFRELNKDVVAGPVNPDVLRKIVDDFEARMRSLLSVVIRKSEDQPSGLKPDDSLVRTLEEKVKKTEEQLSHERKNLAGEQAINAACRAELVALKDKQKELSMEKETLASQVDEKARAFAEANEKLVSKSKEASSLDSQLRSVKDELERVKSAKAFTDQAAWDGPVPEVIRLDLEEIVHAAIHERIGSAMAVWAYLCSLKSALRDAGDRTSALPIVARLGTLLLNHWKVRVSDVERQAKLERWAVCLSQSSGGCFTLKVPKVGAAVDLDLMMAPSGVTRVSEVMGWTVRNETGACFSQAEVT